MSCERYTAAIVDHACGADLPVDARAHLAGCATCGALFDGQRRLLGALDAELSAAIAIDPSPQFAPRVREGIAASGRGRAWWWWPAVAAAGAAAVVAGVVLSMPRSAGAPAIQEIAPLQTTAVDRTTPRESTPDRAPASATPPVERRLVRRDAPRPVQVAHPAPEVIVPKEQLAAVERYMALLRGGQLDTSALDPARETASADLVVAPIAVNPIAVASLEPETTDGASAPSSRLKE